MSRRNSITEQYVHQAICVTCHAGHISPNVYMSWFVMATRVLSGMLHVVCHVCM